MAGPGEILKEVHRLRKQKKDLETRIEQAPRQLKVQEAIASRREEEFRQAQDVVKHLKVDIHEKEVTIKTILTSIKKHEKQLNEVSNKKEYDALQTEIKQEKESISKIEDDSLEMLGELEEKTAKLPELETIAKKARADFEQFRKDQDTRLNQLRSERDRMKQEL